MKKLVLAAVTFFSLGLLWAVPAQAGAASVTVTSTMAGNGSDCEQPGFIRPDELQFAYNDRVTIEFINSQDAKLEVRNVPGGTFEVAGNSTVKRTFQAKGSFTYAAWNSENNCEKAAARIKVSGGWWIRLWPWVLALVGSILVIYIVSKAGGTHHVTPKSPPPAA